MRFRLPLGKVIKEDHISRMSTDYDLHPALRSVTAVCIDPYLNFTEKGPYYKHCTAVKPTRGSCNNEFSFIRFFNRSHKLAITIMQNLGKIIFGVSRKGKLPLRYLLSEFISVSYHFLILLNEVVGYTV